MQNQNYNRQLPNYYNPPPNYPQQGSGYQPNQMSNYQPPPQNQMSQPPYGPPQFPNQPSQYGPPNQMSQPPYQQGPPQGGYGPQYNPQGPYGQPPQGQPPQGQQGYGPNPQQGQYGDDQNQTDIPNFKLLGRGKGIDAQEYYVITHSASEALNAKEDPLSNGIIQKIKKQIGGEWMVFASVEGLKGYDFSLSIVTGNDFLSFTIQNFRFQVCRLRD